MLQKVFLQPLGFCPILTFNDLFTYLLIYLFIYLFCDSFKVDISLRHLDIKRNANPSLNVYLFIVLFAISHTKQKKI